jgi:putative transposase
MTRPLRMIDNESGVVEITSRVQHGRFLLRPSREANDLVLGVLGRAQRMYEVTLYAFIFMSNHLHILMKAKSAQQMSRFMCFLKGNLAKELGRLHDWREHFWGDRYHSASVGDSEEAQSARFIYILANGCKEGLVPSPLDWAGVSSAQALYDGEMQMRGTWYDRTSQYRAGKRKGRALDPSTETVRLSPMPFLEGRTPEEQRNFAIQAVRRIEQETAERHRKRGSKPLGAQAVRRQSPHDRPKDFKPSPAPIVHAATPEEYWVMRKARDLRVAAYRAASACLRGGDRTASFPQGCFPPPLPYVGSRASP